MAEIREITGLGDRRRGREYALQLLFQLDISPEPVEGAIEGFWPGKRARKQASEFASALVRGTAAHREWIDGVLGTISHHWRVSRMAVVDRNVLRLALYEMIVARQTPPVVVINEAIEIAKKYGNEDSGPFINGILDAIRVRVEKGEIVPPSGGNAAPAPRVRNSA